VLERGRRVLPIRRCRAVGFQVQEPRGGRVAEQASAPDYCGARGLLLAVLLHRGRGDTPWGARGGLGVASNGRSTLRAAMPNHDLSADMTTIDGLRAALGSVSWRQGTTNDTPDGTYCPSCGAVRRMRIETIGITFASPRAHTTPQPVLLGNSAPGIVWLTCVQCHERIVVVAHIGPSGPSVVALPSTYGGLTTPATPDAVSYYLDQAQRSQSIGALSAAIAMYRAALEQLLHEQGYSAGMLNAKITALEADPSPPSWFRDLDPDFLRVIKDLGNGAIHSNGGDIEKQQALDSQLVREVRELFVELLDAIYEQPKRKASRLSSLRSAAQSFDRQGSGSAQGTI
jgi:hypothetical protein